VFKIMTWNIENLFKPGASSGPPTQAIFDAKIQGLASTINAQVPDALALQEIGDPAALDDLVQHLQGTWHRRVSNYADPRHIRVAWLARRAITQSEDILNFPPHLNAVQVDDNGGAIGTMGRGAVGIIVQSDSGKPVRLVTTHLKSKLLTYPGGRF
jgi:endonuclease/exonuclease/phosphatase family metal-dependent hydrolase